MRKKGRRRREKSWRNTWSKKRERGRGREDRLSQFLSVADVRNGRTGSRPVSEHAYSIYGYFLYGRPYSLPPWEPIGTLFYTSRRKRKFRKRKYENYPTNRSILPTFFCEIFILFLSLSLSRTLDTSENIFIRFSRFRPERGNFFSFLFFFIYDYSCRDTYIS